MDHPVHFWQGGRGKEKRGSVVGAGVGNVGKETGSRKGGELDI